MSLSEEQVSLLSRDSVEPGAAPTTGRDERLKLSADGLYYLFLIAAWTTILALLLTFINLYNGAIPLYAVFIIFWTGHVLLIFMMLRILRSMILSVIGTGKLESTHRWHLANERRFPLLQYLLFQISWILGISAVLFVFEILLYLYYSDAVTLSAVTVPIYILSSICLLNSMLCKNYTWHAAAAWFLVLIQCILINLKQTHNITDDYELLLAPTYLLIHVWMAMSTWTFLNYYLAFYELKTWQLESLILYIIGFTILFLSTYSYGKYLDGNTLDGLSYEKISLALALISVCLLSAAIGKVVFNHLEMVTKRMGAERPKKILRVDTGGWDIDEDNNFDNNFLVGEIDTRGSLFKPFRSKGHI